MSCNGARFCWFKTCQYGSEPDRGFCSYHFLKLQLNSLYTCKYMTVYVVCIELNVHTCLILIAYLFSFVLSLSSLFYDFCKCEF